MAHDPRNKPSSATAAARRRRAVFFDRDGVLNRDIGYLYRFGDMEWVEGAIGAVRMARQADFLVFVVTNQSGVARGLYEEDAVKHLHHQMAAHFSEQGAIIDDFRYCPHLPEAPVLRYRQECGWRKPGPGMILDLLATWPVDSEHSFLIGDHASDLKAARAAGIAGYLYETGPLSSFVTPLLRQHGQRQ